MERQFIVIPAVLTGKEPLCGNCRTHLAAKLATELGGDRQVWALCSRCAAEWKPRHVVLATFAREVE